MYYLCTHTENLISGTTTPASEGPGLPLKPNFLECRVVEEVARVDVLPLVKNEWMGPGAVE